jgi:hypothetical protein
MDDFFAPRSCLLAPLPEHGAAAEMLSEAVDKILIGKLDEAHNLVRRADIAALFDFALLVMSGKDATIQRRRPVQKNSNDTERLAARMPSAQTARALFARDGWRCRFCGCRVVPPKARAAMRSALPGAIPWSEDEGYHGAFYAISASIDHIIPHSAGGTNEDYNLVTACWSCQFGRGAYSLEEVGLLDPRMHPPIKDAWDGLERLLNRRIAPTSVGPPGALQPGEPIAEARDIPPSSAKSSRLSEAEWFASLDEIQPTPSTQLIRLLENCAELGVSWSLNKVLIVRITVGISRLEIMGVQRDGLIEIPWSIGDKKAEFKDFAEALATAIPGAIVYETPKFWVVSKEGKRRINVLELLQAAPSLRTALAGLHARLMVET